MGTDELQSYVKGVIAAKHLSLSEVKRRTGISRPTLTEITKGRYTLGSERTRDTLLRLADGLEVPRVEMLAAAGLSPEPPTPSIVPVEMMEEVFDAQQVLAAAVDRLYQRMKADGLNPPPPPKPSGGSRSPRTPPPPAGPRSTRDKGNPDTSS